MGFFDFLKKTEPAPPRQVSDLAAWIREEYAALQQEEHGLLEQLEARLQDFINELGQEVQDLQAVDMEKAVKTPEKTRLMVEDNLARYITRLQRLVRDLIAVHAEELQAFVQQVDALMGEFKKSAEGNYEKATILVGKEMAATRKSMDLFSKDIQSLMHSHADMLERFHIFAKAQHMLNEEQETATLLKDNRQEQKVKKDEIHELEEELVRIRKDKESARQSSSYLEVQEQQQRREKLRKEVAQDIRRIQDRVPLKELANAFHSNEKDMVLIKAYRSDFSEAFAKDAGASLMDLARGAKLATPEVEQLLEKVREKQQTLRTLPTAEDPTSSLSNDLESVQARLSSAQDQLSSLQKIEDKLQAKKTASRDAVRDFLKKAGIEFEEKKEE